MSNLVPPHGAETLRPLLLPETERPEELKRAEHLKKVPLSTREVSDLFMLAMGAYTPLEGFMGEEDWRGCCIDMALSNGAIDWYNLVTSLHDPLRKETRASLQPGAVRWKPRADSSFLARGLSSPVR